MSNSKQGQKPQTPYVDLSRIVHVRDDANINPPPTYSRPAPPPPPPAKKK